MTKPPLLMLAEGRKPRPRKAPVVRDKEIVLHMQVVSLLRKVGHPEWRWTHIPLGERRDLMTAIKLKRMGVVAGWPDFILWAPTGLAHGLELKRKGEKPKGAQDDFVVWAARHGVPYSVADDFDQALAVLKHWGALR